MRLKNIALLFFLWIFSTNQGLPQANSVIMTETRVPESQHEYGQWVENRIKHHKQNDPVWEKIISSYTTQNNRKIKISVEYSWYDMDPVTLADGSVSFIMPNHQQTVMKVCGKPARLGKGWKDEYQYVLNYFHDAEITYKVFKNTFFVVSGIQNDKIFYWKEKRVPQTDDVYLGFEMYFPKQEKKKWDPILIICANSFKSLDNPNDGSSKNPSNNLFEDNALGNLRDKDWYEKVKPFEYGFLRLGPEEITALASRFNWNEKQEKLFLNFLKKDYQTQDLKPSFGNSYNAAEYVSENGDTKEERDSAQKEMTDYEARAAAPQNESFQEEFKYIKKLRTALGSMDLEFFEWFQEDKMMYAPKVYGASPEQNYDDLDSSVQVQNYKKFKSESFKNPKNATKYFSLWEKAIKNRILMAESTDPRQWKELLSSPDELARLKKELRQTTHEMFLLERPK